MKRERAEIGELDRAVDLIDRDEKRARPSDFRVGDAIAKGDLAGIGARPTGHWAARAVAAHRLEREVRQLESSDVGDGITVEVDPMTVGITRHRERESGVVDDVDAPELDAEPNQRPTAADVANPTKPIRVRLLTVMRTPFESLY
ncbi:hypothetical protein [Subtercola sp. YIM 133946]|uniref:hypothetical protein n=1 Tax=Subtercola sp. YIM 133946 TaxID=3118909 RepID=UPI002F931CAB